MQELEVLIQFRAAVTASTNGWCDDIELFLDYDSMADVEYLN